MSFFIDLLIVAVFVIAMISGWRRGFVRSFMRIVSLIGALIATGLLYSPVADFLYDKFFLGQVSGFIRSSFEREIGVTGKSLTDLFTELPRLFTDFLNRFSDQATAEKYFESNSSATPADLSEFMAQPIARTISKVAAIILIFFAVYFALKLLTLLLDKLVSLPLLNGLNSALGIILGAVLGLAIAWILAIAIHALTPQLISLFPKVFKENTFEHTLITKALYNFNLFKVLEIFKF